MSTPSNRKLIQISEEAYERLLILRNAQAKALNISKWSITNCASTVILSSPMPPTNGNGSTPPADPCPPEEEKP